MTCALIASVGTVKKRIREGLFLNDLTSGFEKAFKRASGSELNSWMESIPAFLNILKSSDFDNIQILFELEMPIGSERADLVLLGGTQFCPKALVVELKQWSNVSIMPGLPQVLVPGVGSHQHPLLQVLNYQGKLKLFNARAHDYAFSTAVFAHNASLADKNTLLNSVAGEIRSSTSLYTSKEKPEFEGFIRGFLLPCDLREDEALAFSDSPYKQSSQLFDHLRQHGKEIGRNAYLSLANSGMGLTEEQQLIIDDIMIALRNHESKDFIVQGSPGSGKTLLAVSLLLHALENQISCLFALRNNRLMAILRNVLDQSYRGASGTMVFFRPSMARGLNSFTGNVDMIVCDEAQRIDLDTLQKTPGKAMVTVIFLDETQRLNPPEAGTISNFTQASISAGKTPVVKNLPSAVRCFGGDPYLNWVNRLLTDPMSSVSLNEYWSMWMNKYRIDITSDITSLLSALKSLRINTDNKDRIALAASFTESPGVMNNVFHKDNIRIGYPLTSGFDLYRNRNISIPWLMTPSEYSNFWSRGGSNALDRIASIYGAQGFETDYLGLIWGRDLLFRDGQWILGNPNYTFDNIDGLTVGRGIKNWGEDALTLVKNRYRIFLTRGIKGTLIFCEDEETLNYLNTLFA